MSLDGRANTVLFAVDSATVFRPRRHYGIPPCDPTQGLTGFITGISRRGLGDLDVIFRPLRYLAPQSCHQRTLFTGPNMSKIEEVVLRV